MAKKERRTEKDKILHETARAKIRELMAKGGESAGEMSAIAGIYDTRVWDDCMSDANGKHFQITEYIEIADHFKITLNELFDIPSPVKVSTPASPRDVCEMLLNIYDSKYYGFSLDFDRNKEVYISFPYMPPEHGKTASSAAPIPSYVYDHRESIREFLASWGKIISALKSGIIDNIRYRELLNDFLDKVPKRYYKKKTDHEKLVDYIRSHPRLGKIYKYID